MKVSIHQPAYLPWLGYMEKVLTSDVFVFLDTVSFSKDSFDNRNRIVMNNVDKWLTVPVRTSGMFGQLYTEIVPAGRWVDSHFGTIQQAYKKSFNYDKYLPYIKDMYDGVFENATLADICWFMLGEICNIFKDEGFEYKLVRSSDLGITGGKTDALVNICKYLDATEYYSGRMGKDYLDESQFEKNSIKLTYQDYEPNHYYSVVHQLMNFGAYV